MGGSPSGHAWYSWMVGQQVGQELTSWLLHADVETGEWQVQPDSSRLRDLSYTVALNYSFGPKFTHTTEHQVYSKSGQPGLKHIVDTEVSWEEMFYTRHSIDCGYVSLLSNQFIAFNNCLD